MDFDHQPMHKARQALALHPRCGAKCRTGDPCQNASMKNGRCRMHGGKSTGAPIKHGQRTKAAIAQRSSDRDLIKVLRTFASIDAPPRDDLDEDDIYDADEYNQRAQGKVNPYAV